MSDWQPIETAPKDGTPILGIGLAASGRWHGVRETKWNFYQKGSIGFAKWESGDGPLGYGWDWYEPVSNIALTWYPTHWMPLPASPEGKK